jgi:hypothetical protein
MPTDDPARQAPEPPSDRPRGGCLNLGWGCLSVFLGFGLILPVGLWM